MLDTSGLKLDQISSVELTGGSSRVPLVVRSLSEFFGKDPSRTLNAKECVARGAALQCAMLSPIFRYVPWTEKLGVASPGTLLIARLVDSTSANLDLACCDGWSMAAPLSWLGPVSRCRTLLKKS